MKTIIAGSRSISSYEQLIQAIQQSQFLISEIFSGGANGVDKLGEKFAKDNQLPIKQFLPEWNRLGKKAGFMRNIQMGNYAEALIALWDGKSNGTRHMIQYAEKKGLRIYVHIS